MYTEDLITTSANIDFMNDEKFISAYKKCVEADQGRLLLEDHKIKWRIHTLLWAAKYACHLDGDFVDFGGGFGLFSSAIYEYLGFNDINKKYFLFDSFEGLKKENLYPEEEVRYHNFKKFGNWLQEVTDRFKEFNNMVIVPGFIPESLTTVSIDKISFVSIDLNCVNPEVHALEFAWERLVSGGIIIFDDYAFPGYYQQKLVHDKFAKKMNLLIYTNPTGQGILIKP